MKPKRPTTLEPISAAVIVIVALHLGAILCVWWWWQNDRSAQRDARTKQLAWMHPGDFKTQVPMLAVPPVKTIAAGRKATKQAPAATPPKPPVEAPVQKATLVAAPPQQHQMEPVPNTTGAPLFASATAAAAKPAANRSITLRRVPDRNATVALLNAPVPPMTSPTLMDVARLNTLRPTATPPVVNNAAAATEVNLDTVDEAVNAAFLTGWTAPPIDSVPETQREGRLNIAISKDGTVLKAQMSKFSGSHVLDQSILEAAAKVKKISTTLPANFAKESYDLELNFLLLP